MIGRLISIHITKAASEPLMNLERVRAVPGKGLEGDRYFNGTGFYSHKPGPDREVTLIESEALEALRAELNLELKPEESRRNLVTRDVALNPLVGKEFRVGEVRMLGIRLCEPCIHLEELTIQGVLDGLVHRGGLRAQILNEGYIQVGDAITVPD